MRTYLWCVWANKFTFWGYIFLLSGHALMGLVGDHWLIDVVVYSGGCAVGATLGGLDTLMAYQRARIVLIKTNGTLDPELYFRLWSWKGKIDYCPAVGWKLAKKLWKREREFART